MCSGSRFASREGDLFVCESALLNDLVGVQLLMHYAHLLFHWVLTFMVWLEEEGSRMVLLMGGWWPA